MSSKKRSGGTSSRARKVIEEFNTRQRNFTAEDWKQSLERLNRELCADQQRAELPAFDHAQLQDLLVFFVSDEQLGSDVRRMYPCLSDHLMSCAECTRVYNTLAGKE